MIFAVVLVASMTTAIIATVWLTSSSVRTERTLEDQTRMRYAFEAATEQVAQDSAAGTLAALPTTKTVNVNGVSCALTITDNSSSIPHTIKVAATMTWHNRTVTDSKVIGNRKAPSPFYYALFVNNGATYSGTLTTGSVGANGDVYFNGNTTLTGLGSTVNGDFETTGTVTIGTTNVTGSYINLASSVAFPSVVSTNYSSVANQTVTKGSLNGATFSTTSGAYYLIYCSTNTSISGSFSGKGTVFVNGNATISGPISVANSSSRVAIIASGSLSFTSSGPHSAYFYGGGNLTLPLGGVTVSKGGIVANALSTLTAPITTTNDPAVWMDSTEGTKHRLPGFYP